jgi:VCBS repeat-containing protein
VYVLFMNANGTVKGLQKIAHNFGGGPTLFNTDYFGSSISSPGDLDGDGVTDLAVGASGDDTGGNGRGAVHVLFMNENGTVKSNRKIAHNTSGGPGLADVDRFGASLASLGDIDGDGVTDLAVGANRDNTAGDDRGSAYVLLMNTDGTVKNNYKIAHETRGGPILIDGDNFGSSVASLGDLDGDGLTDLVIGARGDDTGGNSRGAVHVLFLKALGNSPPVFTSPNTASVPENTTSVMTVTATDTDLPPQTITFSIVDGADQGRFSITSGGALSFNSPPNFEAPTDANADNVYSVTVQADDGIGGTTTQTINVTVTRVNDNSPVFTSANTANVAETTTAVMTVTATDADLPAQAVSFSIVGGADQARFAITSGGSLSFNSAPNFEAPTDADGNNVYVVTVQASDGNGRTTSQTLSVTVTPVNESSPIFTSATTDSVAENTTAVMTVTATDADLPAQTVSFSIVGGADQARFSITSGGVLSFASAPNFEAPNDANGDNVYVVTVQANDGNGRTTNQTISVTVTPVNDNSPVFT